MDNDNIAAAAWERYLDRAVPATTLDELQAAWAVYQGELPDIMGYRHYELGITYLRANK
jgi:hypothetical protein